MIEDLKANNKELDAKITKLKAQLLPLLNSEKPYYYNDLVATICFKTGTGYGDEKGLIEYLDSQLDGKYLRVKTTKELDKNAFKKGLKEDLTFAESVDKYITPKVTEYVVVTTKENYEKMLEHMNEGK